MEQKFPLSYRTIQKIKAEEYQRFFSQLDDYEPYMNHLGEVQWMTENEEEEQHEFFTYDESLFRRWQRKIKLGKKINILKLSVAERELRLRIRQFLENKYLGNVQPETNELLPDSWKYKISDDELENIPITTDIGYGGGWKSIAWTFSIIAAIVILAYFLFDSVDKSPTGKLLDKTDVVGARVYKDGSDLLGYSNRVIDNVPVGLHRISAYKDGYVAIPEYHEVEIYPDSVATLNFKFNNRQTGGEGYLKILADQKNSKIFVDNDYFGLWGENMILTLPEGQHSVSLQKKNYITAPPERIVQISSGDTTMIRFQQNHLYRGGRFSGSSRSGMGSIEVSSDVNNAQIFLNGKHTGHKTDYIFTQLKLGNYQIRVEKEGYSVEPSEVSLSLTQDNPLGNVHFNLIRKYGKVQIQTEPAGGKIFVDEEFKGEGSYTGELIVGEHTLSFGEISGYKTPAERKIVVKPGSPLELTVQYFPELHIVAGVDGKGNIIRKECEILSGYTYTRSAFTPSSEGGPEVEFNETLNDYVWKLGFAFPYRNPKGNDALKINFTLPRDKKPNQKFNLRMTAASSQEKYPLSLNSKTEIKIKINNVLLSYNYHPQNLEELGGLNVVEWDITSSLEPGPNSFEISTTNENNTYFYIKRIEIFN